MTSSCKNMLCASAIVCVVKVCRRGEYVASTELKERLRC